MKRNLIIGGLFALVAMAASVVYSGPVRADDETSDDAIEAAPAIVGGTNFGEATLRAVVSPAGELVRGTGARSASVLGPGVYEVTFARNVRQCGLYATIGSTTTLSAPPGAITVAFAPHAGRRVIVRTYLLSAVPANLPFHLLVSC